MNSRRVLLWNYLRQLRPAPSWRGTKGEGMSRNLGGTGDSRLNALWGKGTRGGDSRSNALWGKGGRGLALATVTALALTLPLAAMGGGPGKAHASGGKSDNNTYASPGLLEKASANPDATLHLIIQSSGGVNSAEDAFNDADKSDGQQSGKLRKKLKSVNGVAVDLKAKKLAKLLEKQNLVVTPDSRIKMAGLTSSQLWTEASGVSNLWSKDAVTCAVNSLTGLQLDPLCVPFAGYTAPSAPAIAVVDSGIDPRADFGNRLVASVSLYGGTGVNSAGDGRGHGTMVAGLAAGSGTGYAGAAPNAKLVSIDVLDDAGTGRASDVVAAADWILANKDAYGIRVANFSLGVGNLSSFRFDPVNKAVERLWFSGVTVVTSSGNYGVGQDTPSQVKYAPANDPFVITVGASDLGGTALTADDTIAPWSSWGRTSDGFSKPDVVAPGRYMVAPSPSGGTLSSQFADRVMEPGYLRMSGTSFSAAVVSGMAAQILAAHPSYTPDQVKGALMVSADALPLVGSRAAGVGEADVNAAVASDVAPNPNLALNQFVVNDGSGNVSFDGAAWYGVASTNSTWDESTWTESGWAESTWDESTWSESTWSESSWTESTWTESTWTESSWTESTWSETGWSESTWAESTLDR
jgi:serine protease AprX